MAKSSEASPCSTHETGLESPSGLNGVSPAETTDQKRGRGRPPKPKSVSPLNGSVVAQPSRKPSGRTQRTKAVPIAAVVKSDRPKRTKKTGSSENDVDVAATGKKRGRESKSEEIASNKKPVKKTEKAATTDKGAGAPRELKRKAALLQAKVKKAADKLKKAVSAIEEVQVLVAGM